MRSGRSRGPRWSAADSLALGLSFGVAVGFLHRSSKPKRHGVGRASAGDESIPIIIASCAREGLRLPGLQISENAIAKARKFASPQRTPPRKPCCPTTTSPLQGAGQPAQMPIRAQEVAPSAAGGQLSTCTPGRPLSGSAPPPAAGLTLLRRLRPRRAPKTSTKCTGMEPRNRPPRGAFH